MVVDACQGRFETKMLNDLIDLNAITLITGSKFFRGPPFSGGVIVPAAIMKKLKALDTENPVPAGLNTFMGKNEVPRELESWRSSLKDNQNPALAIRWAAAMIEIEKTLVFDETTRDNATKDWRKDVVSDIGRYENLSYFSAAEDTDSIVSVRIKHPDTGKYLTKSELAKVFKAMTLEMSETLSPADDGEKFILDKKCFSGQPVLISKEEAVLRIALGSDSLREVLKAKSDALAADYQIIQKMSVLGQRYNEL